MSYEWAFLRQADLGKAPSSTIERKQMSTKTTLKRIALVAVSALGFGLMTAVAPAGAAVTALTAGTSSPARVGVASTTKITPTLATTLSSTFVASAKVTSAPATSTLATDTHTATKGVTFTASTAGALGAVTQVAGGAYATITPQGSGTTYAAAFNLSFKADVAGTYTILVSTNASGTSYAAGDPSVAVTITTVGAPTKLTLSSVGGSVVTSSGNAFGQLFSLTMEDANGNDTILAANEAIVLSDNSDATTTLRNNSGSAEISAFGSGDDVDGEYLVRVIGATVVAGSGTLTASGTGLLPATLTVNSAYTKVVTTNAATGATVAPTTATAAACPAGTSTSTDYKTSSACAMTVSGLTGSTTATVTHALEITDGLGYTYNKTISIAAATTAATTATYTSPALSKAAPTATVNVVGASAGSKTFAWELPAAAAIAVQGTKTILSATGAKNTFAVLISDQFGNKIQYAPVSVAVSGRNTVASTSIGVTDANGLVSYSYTDAGTTGTKDTITFTGGGTTDVATINYGTVTVSTVTVTGGSTVADTGLVAGTTKTAINAADNGPETSRVAIKAVIKDANGNLLAGVPVTFSVSSGAIYKTAAVDFATVYTGSDGAATSYIFDWKTGTQTVTATAGGVSKTDYLTWEANVATSARVLSGTVTGNIVSYKVVDRFGNPVNGATITLSRTGSGLFGNGASTQSLTTDKTGTADASFTGDATVTAELAATTQGYDAAGKIGTTALTAAVAGTTKGTGDTLAPAGVGKVELKVALGVDASTVAANAAADAAAEAIDAANAATDAANLAAEAADAATVAAEEARDAADAATAAVEELATQVATLMAALKAQITTLANTVAKIAKKVKA